MLLLEHLESRELTDRANNLFKLNYLSIQTDDQLFPFYVMNTVGKFRGIPGLFIAGIFGAALRYI